MRVVVTGATGNIGTSVLAALAKEAAVREIVGIARRFPDAAYMKTRFVSLDVARDPLEPQLVGADAVIHLAWRVEPSHDLEEIERTNVEGSKRVFEASARARVPVVLCASSVGAYAPGPKNGSATESWPTTGVQSSPYSRQKARVERLLDELELAHGSIRVVRMRPALCFKRSAAVRIQRAFLGGLVPRFVWSPRFPHVVPRHPDFRFQVVHSADVGEAFRLALTRDVRGAFNLAADPVIDTEALLRILPGRAVRTPRRVLRGLVGAAWRLHLSSLDAGWVDLCFRSPIMDVNRARRVLGWDPRHSAIQTVQELLDGLREGTGFETPPLRRASRLADLSRRLVSGSAP